MAPRPPLGDVCAGVVVQKGVSMNYRNPHSLRVVTLSSRESQGSVVYPPEFARLASSPNLGDAPTSPVSSTAPRSRESRAAIIILGIGFLLLCVSYLTTGPISVVSGAGAAVWTVVGAWAAR